MKVLSVIAAVALFSSMLGCAMLKPKVEDSTRVAYAQLYDTHKATFAKAEADFAANRLENAKAGFQAVKLNTDQMVQEIKRWRDNGVWDDAAVFAVKEGTLDGATFAQRVSELMTNADTKLKEVRAAQAK